VEKNDIISKLSSKSGGRIQHKKNLYIITDRYIKWPLLKHKKYVSKKRRLWENKGKYFVRIFDKVNQVYVYKKVQTNVIVNTIEEKNYHL
jgi:hypothetical protein